MDPFNLNNIDPNLLQNPEFQKFLQNIGGNVSNVQFPQQQQTPPSNVHDVHQMSDNNDYSPHCYQGSNNEFHGHQSEDESVPETQEPIMSPPVVSIQPRAMSSAARSWSVKEDEALIACYMEHCTDAIIGTNQKASVLWRKVAESWDAAQVNRPHELPVRTSKMLENRWRRMASDINLWVGCYEEAKKATGSGYNEDNTVQTAHTLFRASTTPTRNFLCEHGWRMLCQYPKWRRKMRWAMSKKERETANAEEDTEGSASSGKRNRVDEDGDTGMGTGSFTSGGINRPDGVKKAKAKRKGKQVAPDVAISIDKHNELYSQMMETRRKKLEFEEKKWEARQAENHTASMAAKFDMLKVLVAKQSPTEEEEMFKKKLIQQLYGEM